MLIIIIRGIYHFKQMLVACRKDYCNACEQETLTEQYRSFDCIHLYYIPLIPLGFHTRWICRQCQQDPRARRKTGRAFKVLGVFILALISLIMWAAPISSQMPSDEINLTWAMRLIFPLLLVVATYFVFFRKDDSDPTNARKRETVTPLSATNCPYCQGQLTRMPELSCPRCQVRVYTSTKEPTTR